MIFHFDVNLTTMVTSEFDYNETYMNVSMDVPCRLPCCPDSYDFFELLPDQEHFTERVRIQVNFYTLFAQSNAYRHSFRPSRGMTVFARPSQDLE